MSFDRILGQPVLTDTLRRAIAEDKVANGYIFCGPKGCGKKLTAFVFASALNCKGEGGSKPCQICTSCIRINNGNHPNINIIKPSGASIKIKQIREVINDIAKKPFESGLRVIIIENGDKMTQESQDAFLKTLEEPPQNTVFILLLENLHSLLPTVLSRCQIFNIKRVDEKTIKNYLMANTKASNEEIMFATAYSNGIIGRALEIIKDENFFNNRNGIIEIIKKLLTKSFTEVSLMTLKYIETKDAAEDFLEFLLLFFRDALILTQMQEGYEAIIINGDKLQELNNFSEVLEKRKINDIIVLINNTMKMLNHNVSIKNSIDGMLLNIMEVCNG